MRACALLLCVGGALASPNLRPAAPEHHQAPSPPRRLWGGLTEKATMTAVRQHEQDGVGPNTSKTGCWWKATSEATTPEYITTNGKGTGTLQLFITTISHLLLIALVPP